MMFIPVFISEWTIESCVFLDCGRKTGKINVMHTQVQHIVSLHNRSIKNHDYFLPPGGHIFTRHCSKGRMWRPAKRKCSLFISIFALYCDINRFILIRKGVGEEMSHKICLFIYCDKKIAKSCSRDNTQKPCVKTCHWEYDEEYSFLFVHLHSERNKSQIIPQNESVQSLVERLFDWKYSLGKVEPG